jgi:hypothetical protein
VHQVNEECESAKNSNRKVSWIEHNNLESKGNVLINVHLWKMNDHHIWYDLVPDEQVKSTEKLERMVETQLRRKLFKFTQLDDDDVIVPTIWVAPVMKDNTPMFGVAQRLEKPGEAHGAYKYKTALKSIEDLHKLTKPVLEIDTAKTNEIIDTIKKITDNKLPVKVVTPSLQAAPFELFAKLRDMGDFLYDFIDQPEFIHEAMEFFTDCIIKDHMRIDKKQGIEGLDPEVTWDCRVHYDRIEDKDNFYSLKNSWTKIQAQSASLISPKMYEEFIQPYNAKVASIFGKVYYHGCEDLTEKAEIIKNLPNLRRFHISPWSNIEKILDKLQKQFVYEVCVHTANHLLVYEDKQLYEDMYRLASICKERGVTADINISDIENINHDAQKLIRWSEIAREAVSKVNG